jgi:CRP-like cAMP-binding protein
LIERIPRTATVETIGDCDLYRIRGADFLEAATQAPAVSGALRAGVAGRLARTHPSYRRGSTEEPE